MPAQQQFTRAFLGSITESPDDDAPRLIYADWLDDHGQADRAELIRAQCRLARIAPDADEARALARSANQLLARHEREWYAELPELEGISWEGFTRGFVASALAESAEAFLHHAAAMFAAAPVRSVQIGRVDADAAGRLARSPWLLRLTELNLGNATLGVHGARTLARSPNLANLTSLLLHYSELRDEAMGHLLCSEHLGRLVELYVSGNDLSDVGGALLGQSQRLPRLAELDLRDNHITATTALALAYSEHRQAITTLYLVNNQIGPAGAEALAWTQELPRLARLYLNFNPIGDDGAVAFAESPHREALVELDLRSCLIGNMGARALAASPALDGVRALWMGGNRLNAEAVTLLRRRFGDRLRL